MSFFKSFYKNIIHNRDPDNDTVTVKGHATPKYYGTVAPYPHFNAKNDAEILEAAVENEDVNKDVLIAVLVKRINEQRQMIKVVYEGSTGERLEDDLESALRSDLEKVCMALIKTPAHFDAWLIRQATKGLGTDEDILTEVLATRSYQEIQDIKRVYNEVYEDDLEEVIKDETSGDFTTALLALMNAKKPVNAEVDMAMAQVDAQTLFEASEDAGIDVSVFIDILTSRSGAQLVKTFQHYASISDVSLPKAVDMELSGDIEHCLIDIVKVAWSTPAFFAEKLHNAMKGHGTCEETLIRVLVSRSEVDLKKILEEYRAMYDKSLQEHIQEETDGHFQAVLLALCGPH
ncbi:uncharacterized protein V6R79_005919 [Siganus canaliculatus]